MYFFYFIILFYWKKALSFVWTKMNPRDALCQVNLSICSGEEDFWNYKCISNFGIISPWEKGIALYLFTFTHYTPKVAMCQVGLKLASGFGEDFNLKNSSMYCRYVFIISLWKRAWSFIQRNLNPLHQILLCNYIFLKLARWLFRRFWNFVNVFRFPHLPLKNGVVLHLNKLEFPSSKDALCTVLLKLARWFLRWRFWNFFHIFTLFRNYLPFGKRRGPSFEQTWILFTQGFFGLTLIGIDPVVLEKKMKMSNVYRQTEIRRIGGRRMTGDQNNSL